MNLLTLKSAERHHFMEITEYPMGSFMFYELTFVFRRDCSDEHM